MINLALGIVMCSFVMGILVSIFWTPIKFVKGVAMIVYGEVTSSERVKAVVPFYNVAHAESMYTGRASSIMISTIFFLVSVFFRFIVLTILYDNQMLQFISVAVLVIGLAAMYISNVIIIFLVLKDSGAVSLGHMILYSLIFPLGQNYIGVYLPAIIHCSLKEEETF